MPPPCTPGKSLRFVIEGLLNLILTSTSLRSPVIAFHEK